MDLQHPYLSTQLIAYIGNKRALLPFLHEVFARLDGASFLDPFAGSGAVSRLARLMGLAVAANDWEPYTRVINTCHLCASPSDLTRLFPRRGGLAAVLEELGALPSPAIERRYIARHYAPRTTESADWRTERLFYTTENALRIDAFRWRIEDMYPGEPRDPDERLEKAVLLGPLLYQAATHTNTSGVFKACHHGFGGHGRDALTRIMAPISLTAPVVVDAAAPAVVECQDAAAFLRGRTADICYLDPPYAVHQYGSNYFMLNTIALWDLPPVSDERRADGSLRRKAGIRADWTKTRSAFCYQSTAPAALREVLQAADCRHLVVSYSDEGLIGLEELCDILSETGSLTLRSRGYVKYPGGKQSLSRKTRNLELALVVDRRAARPAASSSTSTSADLLRDLRIARLMGRAFVPSLIRAAFPSDNAGISVPLSRGGTLALPMRHHWRFLGSGPAPGFERAEDAERFISLLSSCEAAHVGQEIDALIGVLRSGVERRDGEELLREILRLFNKLAHRKYAREFAQVLPRLQGLGEELPYAQRFRAGLERIVTIAGRRAAPAQPPGP
ncbi:MAG TPA: DNA adenine methylase [Spirochaetia bacterium]|nr:DNA adenine methylase [Spirochaetia bacterium]